MGTHCGARLLSEQLVDVVVGDLARDIGTVTSARALLLLLDFVDQFFKDLCHLLGGTADAKPDEAKPADAKPEDAKPEEKK